MWMCRTLGSGARALGLSLPGLLLAGLLLPVLIPGAASADKFAFQGTHGITFTHDGAVQTEVTAQGTGVAIVNGSAGGTSLQTLQLTRPFGAINETVSFAGTIPQIRFGNVRINPQLQGGIFAPILTAQQQTSLALSLNTLPAAGTIRLCDNASCTTAITVPLTQTVSGVAVGPGVGGSFTVTRNTGATRITVAGGPWTIGATTASYRTLSGGIMTLMDTGFVSGPLGGTGTTLSATSGTLQLVSATQVTTTGLDPPNDLSGQISRLTIHFTPEPGLLLLLGAGAVGVTLLGRKRLRR